MANNSQADMIRAILPGTDCSGHGGCGFASCELCAKAIAEGAAVNLCPACNDEQVQKIAELLGREALPAQDRKAFIKCGGFSAGKARFYGSESCAAAVEKGFLPGECKFGCTGVGDCVKVCTFNAMKLDGTTVVIDKDVCNGCGACVDVCPQKLVHMLPADASNFIPCSNELEEEETRAICGYGCIGCGECEDACPRGAVKVVNNVASIDYEKCVGCDACTVSCKKKIIIDTYHDLAMLKGKVAFVRCAGTKIHEEVAKLGITTCKEAAEAKEKLEGVCQYGCLGCGDCESHCRYDAIHVVDGCAVVDPEKCVGCGDCVYYCPQNLPVAVPYKGAKMVPCASEAPVALRKVLCNVGCIGCGDCVDNCPDGLIHLENGRAVIEPDNCEDCNICTYVCPNNVIVARMMPEFSYLQSKAMRAGGVQE